MTTLQPPVHTHQIIKIKVAATKIRVFPFDLIYLVPHELKAHIPHMFNYCLVLSVSTPVQQALEKLDVHRVEHLTNKQRVHPLLPEHFSGTIMGQRAMRTYVPQLNNYFLVVPIFRTYQVESKQYGPAYIHASQHVSPAAARRVSTATLLDDYTVLYALGKAIRPICRACPRHLLHINGKCNLGDEECYSSLVLHRDQQDDDTGEADEQL